MPKGKKFDAAEKHFEKERVKLSKEIANLQVQLAAEKILNSDLRDYCDRLEDANRSLNEWIERLLEFTEMSREDVRKVVQNEESIEQCFRALQAFTFTGTLIPLPEKGEQNDF